MLATLKCVCVCTSSPSMELYNTPQSIQVNHGLWKNRMKTQQREKIDKKKAKSE